MSELSRRTFFRTVLKVEILSEEPFSAGDLSDVAYAITEGGCSGMWETTVDNQHIDGKEAAALLVAQASDPSFFNLNEDGSDGDQAAWS